MGDQIVRYSGFYSNIFQGLRQKNRIPGFPYRGLGGFTCRWRGPWPLFDADQAFQSINGLGLEDPDQSAWRGYLLSKGPTHGLYLVSLHSLLAAAVFLLKGGAAIKVE
jgi:hypothetical protein